MIIQEGRGNLTRFIKSAAMFVLIIGQLLLVLPMSRAGSSEAQNSAPLSSAALSLADVSELVLKNNPDIQIARYIRRTT